jgi:uncharacterized membrane protein YphA (DoxX/SURF4 family)
VGGTLFLIAGGAAGVVVALLFLVAGIDKLRHRALLPGVIANYRLLPTGLVAPAAVVLPVAELAVAAGLLLGLLVAIPPVAPLAAAMLLLIFSGAMAINIQRGRRHIDCGCGHAALRQQLGWGQVVRNLALAAGLLPLMTAGPLPPPGGADAAVAVVTGIAVYLLMLLFTTLNAVTGLRPDRARG